MSSEAFDLIFEALTLTARDGGGDSYWWGRSLSTLASGDPSRAAKAASLSLCGEYFQQEEAQKILVELAHAHPEEVMQNVGAVMLDEKSGIRFFVGHYRGLFNSLPLNVISRWLDIAGVNGARKLARHLPVPYIGPGGEPVVPELTEFVLEKFEDDDRTFAEFCAGTYSSGQLIGNFASQFEAEAETGLNTPVRTSRLHTHWCRCDTESELKMEILD